MTPQTQHADYDSPWKEISEFLFPELIGFFFPQAHPDIDWSRGYEFLDKELQQIVRESETGRNTVDKLVKVWHKDGEEAWLLIHIEIQNQVDGKFDERMYIYNYRLYDRYRRPIISLAILGDDQKAWRPESFGYSLWGFEMQLRFPIAKLLDFENRWEELIQNKNPFAVVVMAHLRTVSTRRNPQDRLRWKIEIVKGLYERGYDRATILEIFRFIDWLMVLPLELEQGFQLVVDEYEEATKMRYVTAIERMAEERGIEQGIERGIEQGIGLGIEQGIAQNARKNIRQILSIRFVEISENVDVQEKITVKLNETTDVQLLDMLFQQALLVPSLDEFIRTIDKIKERQDLIAEKSSNTLE